MIGHTLPQMNRDAENPAARAAPAIFVVLWSTGFIATKCVVHNADPLTYLAIRMALVVVLMAAIVAIEAILCSLHPSVLICLCYSGC
jgi:hypothetical protein